MYTYIYTEILTISTYPIHNGEFQSERNDAADDTGGGDNDGGDAVDGVGNTDDDTHSSMPSLAWSSTSSTRTGGDDDDIAQLRVHNGVEYIYTAAGVWTARTL